tara:strand:+ start:853 stop:1506 length:654 start_codon:yes stop_codon:yes gene_type:complete
MSVVISPSILAGNFLNLQHSLDIINSSDAEYVHVDVMDGVFVPNISFGFPVLKAVSAYCTKFIDVHLMIEQPNRYFSMLQKAGAQGLSIHFEGNHHLHRDLAEIQHLGMKAGLALNPQTSLDTVKELLPSIENLLLMSVNPGFGGQQFIEDTVKKVTQASALRKSLALNFKIQVDGGVNLDNCTRLKSAGADNLVAGSSVFKSTNPQETIAKLKSST